jgi:serine/threonine-protein kinase
MVRELSLLERDQFDEILVLADRLDGPRELAIQLIKRQWLSPYQANQILQGRGKGLLVGPYVLMERIGTGGMGEVFKAHHRRLCRLAAVKVVSGERLARTNAAQRFLREAEAAARLSHPNIVAVYDFGIEGEKHYLAMEFIDGIDLARLIVHTGPLPVPLACDFIRQAALGLHHAHEQGFVHRDVKPQNLLVASRNVSGSSIRIPRIDLAAKKVDTTPQPIAASLFTGGTVKILDMGLIRSHTDPAEAGEPALTQHGVVIGTLDYLSPEQARSSHQVDPRADLYSLGCTLYHLLSGRVPFPGGLPLDKLLRHQTETPTPIRELRRDVPVELEQVLLAMLAKRPEERTQTAAAVAAALLPFTVPSRRTMTPAPTRRVVPETNVFADLDESPTLSGSHGQAQKTTQTIVRPKVITRKMRATRDDSRKRSWKSWLAVAAVLLLAVLALPFLLKKPPAAAKAAEEVKQEVAVDRLVDYVPPDAAAVLHLQPRPFLTAPIFRRGDWSPLDPGAGHLFALLGVEARRDVDWIRFHFPSGDADQAHWLAHGTFDSSGFSTGRDAPQLVQSGLYRYSAAGKTMHLGHHRDYLLAGPLGPVSAGLDHAAKGSTAQPLDAIKQLLNQIDRKHHVWLAVAPPLLGKVRRLTGLPRADRTANVLLENTTTIDAGLTCGDDLQLHVSLQAKTDQSARQILQEIQFFKNIVQGWLDFIPAKEYEKRLWLQLVHQAKLTRTGLMVSLSSQVTPALMR